MVYDYDDINWRDLAFTSAEAITSFGFFYLSLISSIIMSMIIFSETGGILG